MTKSIAWLAMLGACGGGEPVGVDAIPAPDAIVAPDGTPGVACANGGTASVSLDLGGNAQPIDFVGAWWNTGHVTKSCFEISVALSTADVLPDPYYGADGVLEIWFPTTPVVGDNTVQLHLHSPDTYLGGTVTLTTLTDTDVAGTVDATDGPRHATGSFTAPRCQQIFDPCL